MFNRKKKNKHGLEGFASCLSFYDFIKGMIIKRQGSKIYIRKLSINNRGIFKMRTTKRYLRKNQEMNTFKQNLPFVNYKT